MRLVEKRLERRLHRDVFDIQGNLLLEIDMSFFEGSGVCNYIDTANIAQVINYLPKFSILEVQADWRKEAALDGLSLVAILGAVLGIGQRTQFVRIL
jgi:hypothetical protein